MLSASELVQIRSDIAGLLPDTCNIISVTNTPDGFGGSTEGTSIIGTAIKCRIDFPNPGKESVSGESLRPFKTGMVTMAYDQAITTENRLVINTNTYNIVGVNIDQSWIGCKRVAVERSV